MKVHIKKELGNLGEQLATEYLEKNKYKIIKRNFYCKHGEIDIIAKDKSEIVFIEVKTRNSLKYGMPCEAVTPYKQKHIKLTSKYYIYKNFLYNIDIRYDVIGIKQNHMYKAARYFLYKKNLLKEFIRFDVIEVLIKKGKFNINHIKQIM